MSSKKLKFFVAAIIILFIIVSVEIIVFGLLSKPTDLQTQNITLIDTSQTYQNTKKNLTVVNITDNTPIVTTTPPKPVPPVTTRAS